jgi:hypothetical protein
MVLGPVGRVLGAPQLPGHALTVLGHPNAVLGPARGVLGRFKVLVAGSDFLPSLY